MTDTIICSADFRLYDYDVIIVGAGAAGLFTALHAKQDLRILLISKEGVLECNSQLAQGGIAAALEKTDVAEHIADTMRVGCYHNDLGAVEGMINESHEVIEKLVTLGMVFDRTPEGFLHATREGGHSFNRIVHHADNTGAELMRTLKAAIDKRTQMTCLENSDVLDLILQEGICKGVILREANGSVTCVTAPQVILATGGIGELYDNTTNSKISTGDGIAMAHRAGAKVVDMEFVQFHPTAFYDHQDHRRFLISEAVRGEGAYLRNESGERFMESFKPLMELSARDVVARAIYFQIQKSKKPCVYLDLTHLESAYITKRFPNIYTKCLEVGIDFTVDLIPVSPVQHYLMGGIWTDLNGQTNIKGLFACGETASTGVHGANRLASNSLLEALVYGRRIGSSLCSKELLDPLLPDSFERRYSTAKMETVKSDIKQAISLSASIFRSEALLLQGEKALVECEKTLEKLGSCDVESHEALNMAQVGLLIVRAALLRKESLGAHKRLENGGNI